MQRDTQRNYILAYVYTHTTLHTCPVLLLTFRPTSKPAGDQDTSPRVSLPCPQPRACLLVLIVPTLPLLRAPSLRPLLSSQPGLPSLLLSFRPLPTAVLLLLFCFVFKSHLLLLSLSLCSLLLPPKLLLSPFSSLPPSISPFVPEET